MSRATLGIRTPDLRFTKALATAAVTEALPSVTPAGGLVRSVTSGEGIYAEIARQIGVSVSAVRKIEARALRKLARRPGPAGDAMSAPAEMASTTEPTRMRTPDEWGEWADNIWLNEHRHVGWSELVEAIQTDALEDAAYQAEIAGHPVTAGCIRAALPKAAT